MFVDVCLCRDEGDEPLLAIAPAFSIDVGDKILVENSNGDAYSVTVEAFKTEEQDGPTYMFIGSCFGEAPDRFKAVKKYKLTDLLWD